MSDLAPDRAALESLLDFYAEAGVDCALDEAPHDRFAEAARPAPAHRPAPPAPEAGPGRRAPSPAPPSPARAARGAPRPGGRGATPPRGEGARPGLWGGGPQ